jgi:hypothetical protein
MSVHSGMHTFSFVLLLVLFSSVPAAAQYAGVPGEIPPLPVSVQLDVEASQPYQSLSVLSGLSDEEAEHLENPNQEDILLSENGLTIARVESENGCIFVFRSDWGFNFCECDNVATVSQLSPTGRYYAVGADGTSTRGGPVYVFDLDTGVKYQTTASDVWDCSGWTEKDFLLIESSGYSSANIENWQAGNIESIPWINPSYMTEAEGSSRDIVLYHGGRSWMILPEDRYYSYMSRGTPGFSEQGFFFDVVASPNVLPQQAGIHSAVEFQDWIEQMGGYFPAFPEYDFRVFVDTLTNSVMEIVPMEPAMVVEGFLCAMRAGDLNGMLDYVTHEQRGLITDSQREDVESSMDLFSGLEYSIREISINGEEAIIDCTIYLPGYTSDSSFRLLRIYGRWLIDAL